MDILRIRLCSHNLDTMHTCIYSLCIGVLVISCKYIKSQSKILLQNKIELILADKIHFGVYFFLLHVKVTLEQAVAN